MSILYLFFITQLSALDTSTDNTGGEINQYPAIAIAWQSHLKPRMTLSLGAPSTTEIVKKTILPHH